MDCCCSDICVLKMIPQNFNFLNQLWTVRHRMCSSIIFLWLYIQAKSVCCVIIFLSTAFLLSSPACLYFFYYCHLNAGTDFNCWITFRHWCVEWDVPAYYGNNIFNYLLLAQTQDKKKNVLQLGFCCTL